MTTARAGDTTNAADAADGDGAPRTFKAAAAAPAAAAPKTCLNRLDAAIAVCCRYYDAQTMDKWEASEDWRPLVVLAGVLTLFWAIVVLTIAIFELTPWVTPLTIALYLLVGVCAIVVGVTKRRRLMRAFVALLLLVGVVVFVCALYNVTTYADDLTRECARRLLEYDKCEHARYVSLVVISLIVATNVVCCGVCIVTAAMFVYTADADAQFHRRTQPHA
jgi:hypothetical protein